MNQNSPIGTSSVFQPSLKGCVRRDPALGQRLNDCYLGELYAVAASTYRSLIVESSDRSLSDLLDEIAIDEGAHFRLLGRLIAALGVNPVIRTQIWVEPSGTAPRNARREDTGVVPLLRVSLREKKHMIDRYQSAMGQTTDRVVRSVLAHILSDEERHAEALSRIQDSRTHGE